MKKILGMAMLLAVVLTACKNNDEFTVKGKLENPSGLKKVELFQGEKLVDSAILNEKGEFKFTLTSPEADFYYLSTGQKTFPIIGKNGDEIEFKADLMSQTGDFELSGSKDSERLNDFTKISKRYGNVFKDIQQEYEKKVSQNPTIKDSLEKVLIPRFEKNMSDFAKETIAFANKNKDNLAGFYAINSLDPMKHESELLKYSQDIKDKFPKTRVVQDFVARMDKLKVLAVGQFAPDFEMASVDGKNMKLSDFKGQYVLLDFWASWCAPCRQENPNLVKQYNAFKDKGFTIFGVSLDDDRGNWLKAIKDDNLTWSHVSELKQWDSNIVKQYGIVGIPASYLLDKEGKILAKNLRAEELGQFLTKTLN